MNKMFVYKKSEKISFTVIDHMGLIKPCFYNIEKKIEIDNVTKLLNNIMKVLSVKNYRVTCDCGTEFEFDSSDIKRYEYDSEYFGIYHFKCVYCPSCKKRISEDKFIEKKNEEKKLD